MNYVFLPNQSREQTMEVVTELVHKGHSGRLMDEHKNDMKKCFQESHCLIALGELTTFGIWVWGYAEAVKKRVIAVEGVNPLMVQRTIKLKAWLDGIPTQMSLF